MGSSASWIHPVAQYDSANSVHTGVRTKLESMHFATGGFVVVPNLQETCSCPDWSTYTKACIQDSPKCVLVSHTLHAQIVFSGDRRTETSLIKAETKRLDAMHLALANDLTLGH